MMQISYAHEGDYWIKYQENKGQWESDISYMARVKNGFIYVGQTGFALQLKHADDIDLLHDVHHGKAKLPKRFEVRYHNLDFQLVNAQTQSVEAENPFSDYVNYFIGEDSSKWAGGVKQFGKINLRKVYPGIDFHLESIGHEMKYEFSVASFADPSQIAIHIDGADKMKLKDGRLIIETSVRTIIDDKPIVWQIVEGKKRFIKASYILKGDTIGFDLKGYDQRYPLIIDPTLIFSSYTGSPSDNWGFTASYDDNGNLYGAGTVFNDNLSTYPTTTGAYDTIFGGGSGTFRTDIAITKFASDGSSLVYSTYLGGSSNECPHSLVVNTSNQLYVLGTTSSNNFPTSVNAYDPTFNGGSTFTANAIEYENGSDIFVTKFNAAGTNLVGSTYMGGTGNDGNNLSTALKYCYGDEFRGEIIVDSAGNCYVASNTSSSNFPVANGFQVTYGGGGSDGIAFKLNANLSSLLWSNYMGGSGDDAAYSVQFELPSNDVYITGGTTSSNYPTTTGTINTTYGGNTDGFLSKVSSNGNTLLASTYIGTSAYDQSYFVQLDLANNVYVVGQTEGSYPVGPAWVYSNPGGGQFLHKLSNNLQTDVFSTEFGLANNSVDLALSAFLVNDCNHIFISGWGGTLNNNFGQTSASTVSGLPVTNNAYQTTTDGNDFYVVVFEDSATNILFATYFGGTGGSGDHVDGGTSRFDKKGIIYQAVCAGCGGSNTFPTTTGAYSTTNGSNNCNLGVFKYDLVTLDAAADIDGPTNVCLKDSLHFVNSSIGGSLYYWDFGDGATDSVFEPVHKYDTAGQYTVQLVIFDSVSCIASDTDYIQLNVIPGPDGSVSQPPMFCPNTPLQLQATGGASYTWIPSAGLNNPNIANPIASVPSSTQYIVNIEDSCGVDIDTVFLNMHPDPTGIMPDTGLCKGETGKLRAFGANSYSWNPSLYLSSSTGSSPLCTPDTTVAYTVTMVDSFGCNRTKNLNVVVAGYIPEVQAWGDTTVCAGQRIELTAFGTDGYEWEPKEYVLDPSSSNTPAYPEETTLFIVTTENACGAARDTVFVKVDPIQIEAIEDIGICEGDTVQLKANGTQVFIWDGPAFRNPNYNQNPVIRPTSDESGWYKVTGVNLNGCERSDSTFVQVFATPEGKITTKEDTISGLNEVKLSVATEASFSWQSKGFIPCDTCDTISVFPMLPTTYYILFIDSNGCKSNDSISVKPLSTVYVPSAFSPDGDGINEVFYVKGHRVQEFAIEIRDRWGRKVYESQDIQKGWNGKKFNEGKDLPIGVYGYTIRYTALPNRPLVKMGTVTLVR